MNLNEVDIAIVVFVKTPGISPYMTRLRKDFGDDYTNEFYAKSINVNKEIIEELKSKFHTLTPYWSIAEEKAINFDWWASWKRVIQTPGDLGSRLNGVYEKLIKKHDVVLFMGADSPHLSVDYLTEKIELFCGNQNPFLIGKTSDGGFYLFGGKSEIGQNVWKDVQYSHNNTAASLVKLLESIGSILHIEENFDIDDIEDLHRLSEIDESHLMNVQKELLGWVKEKIK